METAEAREEGIAKADRGVSNEWRIQAAAAIAYCSLHFDRFSSDDVRTCLRGIGHVPRNWCALGPAFRRAEKAGLIERAGMRGLSQYASTHSAETKLWRRKALP
jgi:hypothetical protein